MDFGQRLWNSLTVPLARGIAARSRPQIALGCIVFAIALGFFDYSVGTQINLSVGYLIPISVAAWFLGPAFALITAIVSTGLWVVTEFASGTQNDLFSLLINCLIRFVFYAFLILVLVRLCHLQKNLEALAEERAKALAREITERERLEHEMLKISEREQRRIGQDLHDGLCQHLTGTAIAGHVLAEKLAARDQPEAAQARRIVDLVEEAISLARSMAKGLHPVEVQADGLMQALEEFASTTSDLFSVRCRFDCQIPVLIRTPATATHLYRIAQEAVSNAIKHGRATDIVIMLEENELGIRLAICDNGHGMPNPLPSESGMGLRIMSDRAKMIGGEFSIQLGRSGGAEINCLIPQVALATGGLHA